MTLKWENIEQEFDEKSGFFGNSVLQINTTWRAKIHGGWLVSTCITEKLSGTGFGAGAGLTFVPDQNHEWTI